MKELKKKFSLIQLDPEIPESLKAWIRNSVQELFDVDDVAEATGGLFYLCETDEDIGKVRGVNNRDLRENQPDVFDIAEYIINGEFVNLWLASNNAGGNTFLIPKALAEKYESIAESVKLFYSDEQLLKK